MLADEPDANQRSLADVLDRLVELAIAFRTGLHHNVAGVHAKAFEGHADLIAVIPHTLQLVEIESPARRTVRRNKVSSLGWRRATEWAHSIDHRSVGIWTDMLYAATQVVLEILSRRDAIALNDVIIRADVHQCVFSRQAWLAGLGGSEVRYS